VIWFVPGVIVKSVGFPKIKGVIFPLLLDLYTITEHFVLAADIVKITPNSYTGNEIVVAVFAGSKPF
jgi:hypothetical protein